MSRVAKTALFVLLLLSASGSAAAAPAPTDDGSPVGDDANCGTQRSAAVGIFTHNIAYLGTVMHTVLKQYRRLCFYYHKNS